MGMDVDYANDKGSYTISRVEQEYVAVPRYIITWSDYRREDKKRTFGLLSQISPDGRYVVSTVKDLSVFVAIDDDLAFSQLFFPVKGILAFYDRQAKSFHALPGADDPKYVQSNPTWSPDGQAHRFRPEQGLRRATRSAWMNSGCRCRRRCRSSFLVRRLFCSTCTASPSTTVKAGSRSRLREPRTTARATTFPSTPPTASGSCSARRRASCSCSPTANCLSFRPQAAKPRRLECNTDRMNSWHSWSPNGRWLVFSSKAYTLYTQLMLTHIDDQGHSTPPVVAVAFQRPGYGCQYSGIRQHHA